MSRSIGFDQHAADDVRSHGKLAEANESPLDLLHRAAALLDQHGPGSSECRGAAERLRRLARALAAAQRAEADARRADAESYFRRQR